MFIEDKQKFIQPKVETNPVSECLLKAANILREKGWLQRNFRSEAGYCLLGAIASSGNPLNYMLAANYMYRKGMGVQWNDAPGRTKEEVIAALEQAAAEYNPNA